MNRVTEDGGRPDRVGTEQIQRSGLSSEERLEKVLL